MDKILELKDKLYYSDLMYEIRCLAGFDIDNDDYFKRRERIDERRRDIVVDDEELGGLVQTFALSPFTEELFEIVREISKIVNTPIKSLTDISKYPIQVIWTLNELEKKDLENHLLINLKSVITMMGLEHVFRLGTPSEQCVCLNKVDNVWEVYIVERGVSFEKALYEDCFDACLMVLNLLADNKQTHDVGKEILVLARKLVPNK